MSDRLHTNFRDKVATKEARGAENSRYMTCDCATTWWARGNDGLARGKDRYIMKTALFVISVVVAGRDVMSCVLPRLGTCGRQQVWPTSKESKCFPLFPIPTPT